jgi:hypothetical protein
MIAAHSHLQEPTKGLSELAPWFMQQLIFLHKIRLPRFHRAGPSTSLDKIAYSIKRQY